MAWRFLYISGMGTSDGILSVYGGVPAKTRITGFSEERFCKNIQKIRDLGSLPIFWSILFRSELGVRHHLHKEYVQHKLVQ